MSNEEKYKFLESLEIEVLDEHFQIRKDRNELNKCIFCDYYCISEEYFQSDLNVQLIYHFYLNAQKKGIQNTYGLFFNPKAIRLVVKYLPFEILKDFQIKLETENQVKNFPILLLYGQIEKIGLQNLMEKKPKL